MKDNKERNIIIVLLVIIIIFLALIIMQEMRIIPYLGVDDSAPVVKKSFNHVEQRALRNNVDDNTNQVARYDENGRLIIGDEEEQEEELHVVDIVYDEVSEFNQEFEQYKGKNIEAAQVKELLNKIKNSNMLYVNNYAQWIYTYFGTASDYTDDPGGSLFKSTDKCGVLEDRILAQIDDSKTYNVSMHYATETQMIVSIGIYEN
jgi:hypothetical protein